VVEYVFGNVFSREELILVVPGVGGEELAIFQNYLGAL